MKEWTITAAVSGCVLAAAAYLALRSGVPPRDASAPQQADRATGETKARPAAGSSYFPAGIGSQWTYRENFRGLKSKVKSTVVTVTGTADVGGVPCLVFESRTDGKLATKDFFALSGTGMFAHDRENEFGRAPLSPPQCQLRFPPAAGQDWEWLGTYPDIGTLNLRFSVEGPEEVAVPAGRFTAFKVVMRAFHWDTANGRPAGVAQGGTAAQPFSVRTSWFADGVGLVKKTFTMDDTLIETELLSYKLQDAADGAGAAAHGTEPGAGWFSVGEALADDTKGNPGNCLGDEQACTWWDARAFCGDRMPGLGTLKSFFSNECPGENSSGACGGVYWAAEEASPARAHTLNFADGSQSSLHKSSRTAVRCLGFRPAQTMKKARESARQVRKGGGDWRRSGDGARCETDPGDPYPSCTWWDAMKYCEGALMSVEELTAWHNRACASRRPTPTCRSWFWSSEEAGADKARVVVFTAGKTHDNDKTDTMPLAKCR